MADSSDEYEPEEGSTESPNTRNLRRRKAKDDAQVSGENSDKKKQKTGTSYRLSLPTDLRAIATMENHISRQLRGLDIDKNVSLRAIRAALREQKRYLLAKRKVGKAKAGSVPPAGVRDTVCNLFSISSPTYTKIIGNYMRNRSVYKSGADDHGRSGNKTAKDQRIPPAKAVQLKVRTFVREQRKSRKRVTGRQVTDFLICEKLLFVPVDAEGIFEKRPFDSAYRTVRNWLQRHSYCRGKRTGNMVMKESVLLHKHRYLTTFFANRALNAEECKREVMMDESYIHEHYHRNNDSVWDPNDDQDIQFGKAPAKGRRYCFAAAIQGPNPRVSDAVLNQDKAGLVPGSVWAFCPQKAKDHGGDYHKVFNGQNFVKWWKEQLLPNLKQKSLIMLDNAKYHKVYGDQVPKVYKLKKQELQEYLTSKSVAFHEKTSCLELRKKAKDYIHSNEKIEIVRLAEEHGHEVLFTPPYHSDLQPIELLWARVKGRVGRQYNNETTLQIVYERLMREFQLVEESGHEAVQKYIDKCTGVAEKMYQEMDDDDDDDDDDGESSGDDTDARDNGEEDEEDDAGDFGDALFDDVGVRAEI